MVHNIVIGKTWVDAYGKLVVHCPTNGVNCELDFKPCGWFGYGRYEYSGFVTDSDGTKKIKMYGKVGGLGECPGAHTQRRWVAQQPVAVAACLAKGAWRGAAACRCLRPPADWVCSAAACRCRRLPGEGEGRKGSARRRRERWMQSFYRGEGVGRVQEFGPVKVLRDPSLQSQGKHWENVWRKRRGKGGRRGRATRGKKRASGRSESGRPLLAAYEVRSCRRGQRGGQPTSAYPSRQSSAGLPARSKKRASDRLPSPSCVRGLRPELCVPLRPPTSHLVH
eukprot:170005-Chlamydomonas_euryale.AAC.6